jgi:hypothetical protein
VIEGYPRSGNSFARHAVLHANPELRIASHLHTAAHVIVSVRLGVPAVVLVRDVDDAVSSTLLMGTYASGPDSALRAYHRFYSRLWPYREHVVVATFDQLVGDFGAVMRRVNERFATRFAPFDHDAAHRDEVFAQLEEVGRRDGWIDEDRVARPSSLRSARSAGLRVVLRADHGALRAACQTLEQRFSALAGAPAVLGGSRSLVRAG